MKSALESQSNPDLETEKVPAVKIKVKNPEMSVNIYDIRQQQLEKACLGDSLKQRQKFQRHLVWVSEPKVIKLHNEYSHIYK